VCANRELLLPCARCGEIEQLWWIDRWQPVCLVCAMAVSKSPLLREAWRARAEARMRQVRRRLRAVA
jgi:hypothetical protein